MTVLEAIRQGSRELHCPYKGSLQCKGCGRYIGLHNRDGDLVGMEYHNVGVFVAERTYLGPGFSGFGMWNERRQIGCTWRDES